MRRAESLQLDSGGQGEARSSACSAAPRGARAAWLSRVSALLPQAVPTEPDPAFLKPSEPLQKSQRAESLGSSQGGGDCEGPGWGRAVPLHPRIQGSSLQGPSEGPEKAVPNLYRHFLPLLPDGGRLSSEFSHILNGSLLSQQGFQQLEPQVDHTRMDAGRGGGEGRGGW